MHEFKLNLGRFNKCTEYTGDKIRSVQYPVNAGDTVSYFMSHDGDIASTKFANNDHVTIPLFDIGTAVDTGRICDPDTVELLLSGMELEILSMIRRLLSKRCQTIGFTLENIHITVGPINMFDEPKRDGCYGWVEVGISLDE